jgi:hypothetical protein
MSNSQSKLSEDRDKGARKVFARLKRQMQDHLDGSCSGAAADCITQIAFDAAQAKIAIDKIYSNQ